MLNSDEIVQLAESINKKRIDSKELEELRIKNISNLKLISNYEEQLKDLFSSIVDEKLLLDKVSNLEFENEGLQKKIAELEQAYTFVITSPEEKKRTVYGEISRHISSAEEEIIICSPWITYIMEELEQVKEKNNIKIRVLTRLTKEDVELGMTDINKFKALQNNFSAEMRYNNSLHAKIVVVDKKVAIVSSANFTRTGLSVNYEAGVSIMDKQAVLQVIDFFENVWSDSSIMTEEDINRCAGV
ncbi:MAG: phospholipase D family protein [Candidatus Thermoplasmatota archaeon]|nr:NgoFVII family restriction endonuclease [Euryarchaeota archaeon]MBU4031336.1 phospholipase D family protein [Candidatus Thermoplasmatota archaeon]MBU4071388.1 phospholipase D family protein [Candidatus Thermoplasmatota archaeon]MBU4143492.1 phospholipase D family protein [Candidatus Thermoplasmatota archaeon]MBU4591726.1 phospholipase D family protein [Candidatus Thermoplasmatota archaeon]